MKLASNVHKFHSSGAQANTDFKVANSIHMMRILSDSLYSDKISAVIRELSTNAYDSHVAASCEHIPFDVHLPSSSNPVFSIRDYGTGLSKEQILKMYTVYGYSNKSSSDNYIGCFGIGSKSPFAYTNIFNTISYYNGIKYFFVNAIGKNGQPSCNLLHSEETQEPNGLEISFDLNKVEDIPVFLNRAAKIYTFFKVKPNILTTPLTSDTICEIPDFTSFYSECEFSSQDFYCLEPSISEWMASYPSMNSASLNSSASNSLLIMGQVAYPLVYSHFKKTEHKDLIQRGIHLYVNIGEVQMDASRENLQYNDYTIQNIEKKLELVIEDIVSKIQSKLSQNDCMFDAIRELYDIMNKYKFPIRYQNSLEYNNKKFSNVFVKQNNGSNSKLDSEFSISPLEHIEVYSPRKNLSTLNRWEHENLGTEVINVDFKDKKHNNFYFIYNDLANRGKGVTALKEFHKSIFNIFMSSFPRYILIQSKYHSIDYVLNKFGITKSHLTLVSSLPQPTTKRTRNKNIKKEKNVIDVFMYQSKNFNDKLISVQKNIDEGTNYYFISNKKDLHNLTFQQNFKIFRKNNYDGSYGRDNLQKFVNFRHILWEFIQICDSKNPVNLYFITKNEYDKIISEKTNWISISDLVKDKLTSILNNNIESIKDFKHFDGLNKIYRMYFKLLDYVNKDTKFYSIVNKANENKFTKLDNLRKINDEINICSRLLTKILTTNSWTKLLLEDVNEKYNTRLQVEHNGDINQKCYSDCDNEILKLYPLFNVISEWRISDGTYIKECAKYINLLDKEL